MYFDIRFKAIVPQSGELMQIFVNLMSVVVMRLGSKGENSADDAIRLLSKLFSTELGYEKKLGTLQDEFHISVTKKMSKEVLDVCNLSTGIFRRGEIKGEMKKAKKTALNLNAMGIPVDKIAQAVETNVATIQEWLSEPQKTPAK